MLKTAFSIALFLVIYIPHSNAFECKDKSTMTREASYGVEMIACGNLSQAHPKLGKVALPNAKATFTRLINGQLIYSKEYSTDQNGIRKSSSSHRPGKKKHFLYIDGSVSFGDGLNDDETTTHWINLKSKTYEAYAIGFQYYMDQHNWLQFEEGDLPQKVQEKTGRAMLISYDFKMDLFAARRHTLPVISNAPHIQEDQNGVFRYLGSFADTTTYFNKFLLSFCLPVPACNSFLFSNPEKVTAEKLDSDAAGLARFYSAIDKLYRKQFNVEEFVIGWIGTPEGMELLKKHLTMPIVQLPEVKRYPDGHPTPEGAKIWADFILKTQLQN